MKRMLLVVLPLLVVVALGYGWGRHWMSGQLASTPPAELDAPRDCSLNRAPCEIRLPDGGLLRIEFSNEPVPLQPFRVQAYAPDMKIDALTVDFQMREMYMGINRYSLQRQAEDIWSREVMLPVCATGRSDWQMFLRIDAGQDAYRVALPFEAAAARGG